jgi:hypothetical protein
MTTLLDKQRSAFSNTQNRDAATLNRVLRIAGLAPMIARLAPDTSRASGARVLSQVGTDLQHAGTAALRRP